MAAMSSAFASSSSASTSGCRGASSSTLLRVRRPKRSGTHAICYRDLEADEVEEESLAVFDHIGGDNDGDGGKVKSTSPSRKRSSSKCAKEEKNKSKKKQKTETEPKQCILVIPGSPILNPPPTPTKYMNDLYNGSKLPKLELYDLFELADLEHQHRKLHETVQELFSPGTPNLLQKKPYDKLGQKKKLEADQRTPHILLQSARADLFGPEKEDQGEENSRKLRALSPNTYPLIRYINETPFFELHTFEPEELVFKSSVAQLLGFADEETMSLSKLIYEFLVNFQEEDGNKKSKKGRPKK